MTVLVLSSKNVTPIAKSVARNEDVNLRYGFTYKSMHLLEAVLHLQREFASQVVSIG